MQDTDKLPLVSIITVVFNDEKNIAKTIESVLSQTYPHIEYIIIDGKSTDRTVQNIENYINKPNTFKHKITKFISEKDEGIYDAMNKGVKFCTGEWCNFMNSGDMFFKNTTIEEIFPLKTYKTSENKLGVIYGDSQLIYDASHSKILYSASQKHKYHHHFIHQSSFTSTTLLRQYPFDTRFKIAADSDFFAKIYHQGFLFEKRDVIIAQFNLNGISANFSYKIFKESCMIGYKYNALFPVWFFSKTIFYILPRLLIRKILPKKFLNTARVYLSKNKI
ncbi:glycosyltransferase family 2 protein [Helicobacter sp. 13S00477-4]|uniref:glycosyltransferase family 2 protein n=1 Tax=Helicobacter sp. 13S00477-4 TaxID=1905759 RepID=UPI000BA750A5|nr:glycosyltransferase family 2 protein [Helicobacter sp. 13S00477-4]PAF51938.1 hypothetical protein BKH44_04550 [Helicobacter sp. 13S00477-4]